MGIFFYYRSLYSFLLLIGIATLFFTSSSYAYQNGTYYPPLSPPGHVYVAATWNSGLGDEISLPSDFDQQMRLIIMLESLSGLLLKQGNFNGIFVETSNDYRDNLNQIISRRGITLQYVSSPSTSWDIVNYFKSSFGSKYILYDLSANPGSLDVARMAAYKYNAIMVDKILESIATTQGLSLAFDCSTMNDQWIYNNWWPTWPIKDIALDQDNDPTYANDYYCLNDYAAAIGPVCFFEPTDTSLRSSFLRGMPDDSPVLGWSYYGELAFTLDNTVANKFGTVENWTMNEAFYSAFRDTTKFPLLQKTHSTITAQPNTHYVTFVWSDGDNLSWEHVGYCWETVWWANPDRGKVPIGWGISPSMRDLGQTIIEYLYETATVGKDYFIDFGPMGYANPSMFSTTTRWLNASRLNNYMGDLNLNISLFLDKSAFECAQVYQPYLAQPNIDALFYWDSWGNYAKYNGAIQWVNNKPVISARTYLASTTAALINTLPKDPTSQNGYSMVIVSAWSNIVSDIFNCANQLDPNVVVVTPEEFVELIKANVSPTPPQVPIQIIDQGNWQLSNYVPANSHFNVSTNSVLQSVDSTPSTQFTIDTTYSFANMSFTPIDISTSGSTVSWDIYGDGSRSQIRLAFYSNLYSGFIYTDIVLDFTGWRHYQLKLDGSDGLNTYGATYSQINSSIYIFQVSGSWNGIPAIFYLDNVVFNSNANQTIIKDWFLYN